MGRKAMLFFLSVVTIMAITFVFVYFASGEEDGTRIEFLKSYGWEVDKKAVDEADVIIPKPFDRVYESYNDMQKRAGLDLTPYMGMRGRRYTYIVTNYPYNVNDEIRANIICINGKCVAGDIMTVSAYGFMHSLNFSDAKE